MPGDAAEIAELAQSRECEYAPIASRSQSNSRAAASRPVNGTPLGPLGAHGQVRDMVVTPDKFQFVSTPNESE